MKFEFEVVNVVISPMCKDYIGVLEGKIRLDSNWTVYSVLT